MPSPTHTDCAIIAVAVSVARTGYDDSVPSGAKAVLGNFHQFMGLTDNQWDHLAPPALLAVSGVTIATIGNLGSIRQAWTRASQAAAAAPPGNLDPTADKPHLISAMTTARRLLLMSNPSRDFNYWLVDEQDDYKEMAQPSYVTMVPDVLIGALQEEILKENPNLLLGRDASQLDVYLPGSTKNDWSNKATRVAARNKVTDVLVGAPDGTLMVVARQPRPTVSSQAMLVAELRRHCAERGIQEQNHVIQRLRADAELLTVLTACESHEDFHQLYDRAARRLGSSTKGAVVAVDTNRNIVIDGVFRTPSSTSDFYYAFESGDPCLLKLSKQAVGKQMLQVEAEVYTRVKQGAPHPGRQYLVPHELVELDDPRPSRHPQSLRSIKALKMQIFARTLEECPNDPRLTELYLKVGQQVLSAMQALHALNLVHCDIKPSNIFVTSDGTALLGDYDAVVEIGRPVMRSTHRYLPETFRAQFTSAQLLASPALDYAMLTYTLLECLGLRLTPDLEVDRVLATVATEVEQFQRRGGPHSGATQAIENAKEHILKLLQMMRQHNLPSQPS